MKEYIRHLERLNSTDYTAESAFLGEDKKWFLEKNSEHKLKLVEGKMLGARHADGGVMTLEQLLGNSYVDVDSNAVGIYIPENEILRRSKYQWFARLSTGQALTSDTILGKYLVLAVGNESCL